MILPSVGSFSHVRAMVAVAASAVASLALVACGSADDSDSRSGSGRSYWSPPASQEDRQLQLATGYVVFVQFHEFGHALVDLLKLPVVGPEEDVVDEFATLLSARLSDPEMLGPGFAEAGALGFLQMWQERVQRTGGDVNQLPYWDEHSLEIKRFYNIVCRIYASAPGAYAMLAEQAGLPLTRAQRCVAEHPEKVDAWNALLSDHMRRDGASDRGGRVRVQYGSSQTAMGKEMDRLAEESRAFDEIAVALNSLFNLPEDMRVAYRDCGVENAYWSPGEREIVMCHELQLGALRLFGLTEQAEAPDRTGSPPARTQAAALVGTWRGPSTNGLGFSVNTETILAGDGSFSHTQWLDAARQLRMTGRYDVIGDRIRLNILDWQPRETCSDTECWPIRLPPEQVLAFALRDANTLQTSYGTYVRVR